MVIGTFHLYDETRSSLLSSSVVKVHHSFGPARENRSCVCRNEGFRLNDLRDDLATGGIRCRDHQCYGVRDGPVKGAGLRAHGSAAVEPRRLELLTSSLQSRTARTLCQ